MMTKEEWSQAGWRALRTFAQSALAMFGTTQLDLFNTNLMGVLSVSSGSALLSLLMSIDRGTAVNAAINSASTVPPAVVQTVAPSSANYIPPTT